ncbi:MAG TPA: CheR family methyltransferase [Gammaproteobacteria bacterium]
MPDSPSAASSPPATRGSSPSGRGAPPCPPGSSRPLIVGVGVSAGGTEALLALLRATPPRSGIAFVIIPDGPPHAEGSWPAALEHEAIAPVQEVASDTPVEPNAVYLPAPGMALTIRGGVLHASKCRRARGAAPLDRFLATLAADAGERGVAVVLSGGGLWGVGGLRDIKENGGLTIVEEPPNGAADCMPKTAFAMAHVDMILPVERMPEKLLSYAQHSYLQPAAADSSGDAPQRLRDEELLAITELLRRETTHDFRRYRKNTLSRRIQRRMGLNQIERASEYLELLHANRLEVQALRRDLLICVTRFFRDREAWAVLEQRVLRELAASDDGSAPIRAWVPGCATGEEAYTLAMLLHERNEAAGRAARSVQVFATDVAEDALDAARSGLYPLSIENDVSSERLARFFVREGNEYRVSKQLRESVIFAEQNVLAQPPFSRLDLICCRNLLIYLEPDAQRRVMVAFQYALKHGGYLFLGTSETVGAAQPLFAPVSKKWRIYRRTGITAALPVGQFADVSLRLPNLRAPAPLPLRLPARSRGIPERVQRQLLKELDRGVAVVDSQGRLLYLHGAADLYLQLSLGEVGTEAPNVLELAREGLRSKLRAALRSVRRTGEPAEFEFRVLRDGRLRRCSGKIRPLEGGAADDGLLLLSFEPVAQIQAPSAPAELDHEPGEEGLVQELRQELGAVREQLNSTIEDLEAANDALKASHEEAISMNEELQAGNEELETSREELQSLNEELTTLNAQLEAKVAELQTTTADLDNLLTSSHVPTLILDTEWRIRRFTPSCTELFNLIAADIGRPLTDIAATIDDPWLVEDGRAVLRDLQPRERQLHSRADDRHYQRRVLPYRTPDDRVEGVVLTFADVTELQRTTEKLRRRERQQEALAGFGRRALGEKDLDALIQDAVRTVQETFEADFVKLLEVLPDGRLLVRAGHGWREGVIGHVTIDEGSDSQAVYTLASNTPVVVRNLNDDARFGTPTLLLEHGVVSGLSTIIPGADGPIGVLGVHTRHEATFSADDIDFIDGIARTLSEAIERRRGDEAVRAAEERLRLATLATNLGTWDYHPQTDELVASARSKELFGLPPDAEIRYRTYLERVHPEDRRRVDEATRRGLDPSGGGHCELEYRTAPGPDGSVRWIRDIRQTFFADGRPVRMIGTLEDVTQRKEAEQADRERLQLAEQLRRLADATPGTLFTFRVRSDGGPPAFPYTSPNVRDTWGLEPEDVANDAAPLFARIHPEDGRRLAEITKESAAKMGMWHAQFRYAHPRKGNVWIESYASPVAEPDGTILWHGIALDITEMKLAEHELREARRIAETADRAKGEFLANMSHEIRTPMSAILGYAEILAGQLEDPDNLQSLDTIRTNGLYLLEIIDDILDLSRIEAGKLELDLRRVQPAALVWEVHSLLRLHAAEKGLALEVEFDGRLPESIETDPTRLKQILINLVENAIKFTDEGEVRIVVCLMPAESQLRFDIVDTGCGIPDTTLAKLFQPFTQADSSVTRRFGGSGLGLSISRALSRMLGGDITVSTKVGEGSTFTLTVATGDLKGVGLFDPRARSGVSAGVRVEVRALACSVLVVDDRRDMRYLAQHMLEEAGARVALAADGREAIRCVDEAAARGAPFDAILLDMQMPVVDGYAAAKELRARGYDKPIIALTANAMKQDERKCLGCGCDDYLSKPLARATLVNTVAYYTQDVTAAELADRRRAYGFAPAAAAREAAATKVLLVDDNRDSCTLLKLLLKNAGCEVVVAGDAEAAEAACSASGFDVAVVDLGLPDMPGEELVRRLRGRPELSGCRFICLSGRGPKEIDWRAAGFDHFVQKPARFEELKRLVGLGARE